MPRQVGSSGVTVDVCPDCRGLWFDAGEMEAVVDVAAHELHVPPDALKTSRICPRCAGLLFSIRYPQTYARVGMCDDCKGLWLDEGALREIRTVRLALEREGRLDEFAPVPGLKGGILRTIDAAIAALSPFDRE